MEATADRRLPGIRFETRVPPSPVVLPRMDIAGFAGFAAAGPFDRPVPIDDAAAFERAFGGEVELVPPSGPGDDGRKGHLDAAVRSFFANGGRRCWVVRTGAPGTPRTAFPLPGAIRRLGTGRFRHAELAARSIGTFADGYSLASAAVVDPMPVLSARSWLELTLAAPATDQLVAGDVIRLIPPDLRRVVQATVGEVRPASGAAPAGSVVADVSFQRESLAAIELPALHGGEAVRVDHAGRRHPGTISVVRPLAPGPTDPHEPPDGIDPDPLAGQAIRIAMSEQAPPPPRPGEMVHLLVDAGTTRARSAWIRVDTVSVAGANGAYTLAGPAWRVTSALPLSGDPPDTAERVRMSFSVREASREQARVEGVALSSLHPRYAGRLGSGTESDDVTPEQRFPLAGDSLGDDTTLIALGADAVFSTAVPARIPPGSPAARNGIEPFDANVFLDERLRDARLDSLPGQADALRVAGGEPLRGVHAFLDVDEVTLVAAPDALHGGWSDPVPEPLPEEPPPPALPPRPGGVFADCARQVPPIPVLKTPVRTGAGVVSVSWTRGPAGAISVLRAAGPGGSWEVYRGPANAAAVRLGSELVWLRVRAELAGLSSDWSPPQLVDLRPPAGARVRPPQAPDPVLLDVQRGLLRMCAARGDLVALLALPRDFSVADALAHAKALRAPRDASARVPAIDEGERRALGFGALHHPWPVEGGAESGFAAAPPEGALMGTIAARSAARGAWVAAGNIPLAGTVALSTAFGDADTRALVAGAVNVLRRRPAGFLTESQDTLADDADARPLNVRRLLALLRRLALLEGARFVFEPDGPAFRRSVEHAFREVLGDLHALGAFAPARSADAYRVLAGGDSERGRLIVELRVAPSLPLRFLTVRLVNDEQRGLSATGS